MKKHVSSNHVFSCLDRIRGVEMVWCPAQVVALVGWLGLVGLHRCAVPLCLRPEGPPSPRHHQRPPSLLIAPCSPPCYHLINFLHPLLHPTPPLPTQALKEYQHYFNIGDGSIRQESRYSKTNVVPSLRCPGENFSENFLSKIVLFGNLSDIYWGRIFLTQLYLRFWSGSLHVETLWMWLSLTKIPIEPRGQSLAMWLYNMQLMHMVVEFSTNASGTYWTIFARKMSLFCRSCL